MRTAALDVGNAARTSRAIWRVNTAADSAYFCTFMISVKAESALASVFALNQQSLDQVAVALDRQRHPWGAVRRAKMRPAGFVGRDGDAEPAKSSSALIAMRRAATVSSAG
jgi:hypothetical protein